MRSCFLLLALQTIATALWAQTNLADIFFPLSSSCQLPDTLPSYGVAEFQSIKNHIDLEFDHWCKEYIVAAIAAPNPGAFRKLDLSGDGVPDMVFSDYCGGEEDQTTLWTRDGASFQYQGAYEGKIVRILYTRPLEPCSLLLLSGYCCARDIGTYTLYRAVLADGHLRLQAEKVFQAFAWTDLALKPFAPRTFLVVQTKCALRESPLTNDSLDGDGLKREGVQVFGNILAEFGTGSRGTAFGYTDSSNDQWWFVAMDDTATPTYSRFLAPVKSFKCGWMKASSLVLAD